MASSDVSRPSGFAPRLLEFADELRREGMHVGTSELLDAFAALEGFALDGAEEVAVEQDVEDSPVLLRLRERCGEGGAEVLLVRPRDVPERGERVEQLGRAHVHAFATELVGELEEPGREAARRTVAR